MNNAEKVVVDEQASAPQTPMDKEAISLYFRRNTNMGVGTLLHELRLTALSTIGEHAMSESDDVARLQNDINQSVDKSGNVPAKAAQSILGRIAKVLGPKKEKPIKNQKRVRYETDPEDEFDR